MSGSVYLNDVIVDPVTGEWLGDFPDGDGPFGPFGFCRCLGSAESCTPGRLLRFFNVPPCCNAPTRDAYLPVHFAYGVQSMTTILDSVTPAAWSSATTYEVMDLVTYGGQIYVSIAEWEGVANVNQQPDVSPLYWQPFDPTLAGSDGDASCLVELPGASGCGFGWAGQQTAVSGDWVLTGALVGDTGWHPKTGECWKFSCWAKALDVGAGSGSVKRWNGDTFSHPGVSLDLSYGIPGFSYSLIQGFPLTMGEWVFCEAQFNWTPADTGPGETVPYVWPLVMFFGDQLDQVIEVTDYYAGNPYTHNVHQKIGHVLIRDLHLYPCVQTTGNWIDSFHGHG